MNKLSQYTLKYILPLLFLLVIIFLPYCNRAYAAGNFTCSGNIFTTLQEVRDAGKGGANPITEPYAIFKVAGCILAQLTTYILSLGNIIAVIMIMISGLRYMGSAGNPTVQQGAMKSLNAAVIGFAIMIMFWSLFQFIIKVLAVS